MADDQRIRNRALWLDDVTRVFLLGNQCLCFARYLMGIIAYPGWQDRPLVACVARICPFRCRNFQDQCYYRHHYEHGQHSPHYMWSVGDIDFPDCRIPAGPKLGPQPRMGSLSSSVGLGDCSRLDKPVRLLRINNRVECDQSRGWQGWPTSVSGLAQSFQCARLCNLAHHRCVTCTANSKGCYRFSGALISIKLPSGSRRCATRRIQASWSCGSVTKVTPFAFSSL